MLIGACADAPRPVLTGERIPAATAAPAPVATAVSAPTAVATVATPPPAPAVTEVESLTVEVVESFPHDPDAFTQGLEFHDGVLLESTGLRFESDLRRVILETGEVTQIVNTPSDFFAEGLTKVGNELIQITWQDQTAFYWDATTFEQTRLTTYSGDGWGLCYDGTRLIMTDGTPVLIFRDPDTFAELGRVDVTLNGSPLTNLNEVECVEGQVWANVWQTNLIVRIDPASGLTNAVVDASTLVRQPGADVLNGIAWDPSTRTFLVTGKLWDTLYRVNFVPAAG